MVHYNFELSQTQPLKYSDKLFALKTINGGIIWMHWAEQKLQLNKPVPLQWISSVRKIWHFIRHEKENNVKKPAKTMWTALVNCRPMESHIAVGCPLKCRGFFFQSPGFARNIFPSHKSQLMQHGWKTVISHDALSFLDRFVWETFTTGERDAMHCRWRILLETHALANELVLLNPSEPRSQTLASHKEISAR